MQFPTEERNALPEVSPQYESNVPGLYVVGALGGFPLIKQALNQGYEVIEHIVGEDVEPTDAPLLREKISVAPGWDVDGFLDAVRQRVPIFAEMNALVLRDTMLESEVHNFADGDIVFRRNDYTNSLYVVVEGAVRIHLDDEMPPKASVVLEQGAFFGEMGLISGRRRNATVSAVGNALLLEVPRRAHDHAARERPVGARGDGPRGGRPLDPVAPGAGPRPRQQSTILRPRPRSTPGRRTRCCSARARRATACI